MVDMEEVIREGTAPMGQSGERRDGPPKGWMPPMADISWVKRKFLDVPYGKESRAQCFDLYLPEEGEGPFPLLLHIHGGGFALGDKRDDHMNAYLEGIKRGMAVASVEYRLSGEAVFPAAVLDCREAVRYIRKHAKEYQVDPERIVAIGGSAGGNLVSMLAMEIPNGAFPGESERENFEEEPFVALAVDQFGPMNFRTMDEQARANGVSLANHDEPFSPESKYLGMALPDASEELCRQANPAAYISEHMCKMLVQHGTHDRLVPFAQSEEFVAAIHSIAGEDKVTFVPLEGADHEDKQFFAEENMEVVFGFIRENLK